MTEVEETKTIEPRESQNQVEATFERIRKQTGVEGLIVVSIDGQNLLKYTMASVAEARKYASLLHQLCLKTMYTVRDLDTTNSLKFLRIRTKKHEIMLAPDNECILIVIQNPGDK